MPDKDQLHRCVRSVTLEGMDRGLNVHDAFSRAYGICKGNLIQAGWLVANSPRSETPSPAGRRRIKELRKEPDHRAKLAEYESLKRRARKVQRTGGDDLFRSLGGRGGGGGALLESLSSSSGLESAMRGAANRSQKWIQGEVKALRQAMDPVFSCDTVFGDCKWPSYPSAGHCFMAALAVQDLLGGQILYGTVNDIHHYWNQVGDYEVDITADQFDEKKIQVKKGKIRPHIAVFGRERYKRPPQEQNDEALQIYDKFRKKLTEELSDRDLCEYVHHLRKMP